MWPKKSSRGPISEDEPIHSPRIMKGMQENYSTDGEKATVVRFHKPSRIHFRRPAMPSPEPIVMEDPAGNTGEE